MNRAVFLDRDGVLVEDVDLLVHPSELRLLEGVPAALNRLHSAGFRLVVVSNQSVVARGLVSEAAMDCIHEELKKLIRKAGGPDLDAVYFCPHHPNATLPAYRMECECRKPRPGLLLGAAREHDLDLPSSFMVGDRPSDILAGARAGCRTIWVRTGRHLDPPIQSPDLIHEKVTPTWTCAGLSAAAGWILASDR